MEILLIVYYETGQIHEMYGNFKKAKELYTVALVGLSKLNILSAERVWADLGQSEQERYGPPPTESLVTLHYCSSFLPHPLTLLITNRITEILFALVKGNTAYLRNNSQLGYYSRQFLLLWAKMPFSGNPSERKKLFGRPVPLPFTLMSERRDIMSTPGMRALVDSVFRYDPDSHSSATQAWLKHGPFSPC